MTAWRVLVKACAAGVLAGLLAGGTARAQDELAEAARLAAQVARLGQQGQYAQAIPSAQRVLAIREKVLGPEHPDTATSLAALADLHASIGQYAQALPLFQRALAIREKVLGAEHPGVAVVLNDLGELYRTTGQYAQALPLYQRALAITEKTLGPEHPSTATRLNNLALLYSDTGQYGQALTLARRALVISEKALGPDHPDTATRVHNLALLYARMGQHAQALPLAERALAIREKALGPEHPRTATSLLTLASLHRSMGHYAQALPLFERALAIAEKTLGPQHPITGAALNNLAGLYRSTRQYDRALQLLQRALEVTEAALGPDHPSVAGRLNNLALVHLAMGQREQALPLYLRALVIRQREGDAGLLWTIHGNLMSLYARPEASRAASQADLSRAIWHGKQAVNAIQAVRAGLREADSEAEQGFLRSKTHYYTRLADLLVQQGRIAEAEQVLGMLKERELSELLQRSDTRKTQADEVGVEASVSRQNADFAARGAKFSSELAALERKARQQPLSAEETARKDELLKAAQAWRDDYQRWLAGLSDVFVQSGRSRGETAEVGTKLQVRVRAEPGAVGLHYIVSDERIAIIVATARASFGRFSEVRREELNRQIAALRQAIVNRADVLPASQALYKALIAPVAKDLEEAQARTLVLSLTDTLRYVPFAALHDGKSYLVERYPLALYASAGGGEPKAGGAAWQVAALGLTQSRLGFNPLPAVRGELEGIVRTDASPQGVLPGRIALDQAFDRARLQDALLGGYSVVHVASHFSFAPGDESRSVLLPGAGEPISLGQLAVMDFSHVQQLTLSACETATGGGANENGAEVEGLAAAVQAQGAQSVLASLWKVSDASTAQLMRRFYAQRAQSSPVSRAVALQQAQLALLKGAAGDSAADVQRSARPDAPVAPAATPTPVAEPGRPYAHPYFWAPFVLSGNWL